MDMGQGFIGTTQELNADSMMMMMVIPLLFSV
jgi:hypothetical protein